MNRHPRFFAIKNDQRKRKCPACGKVFVRSNDEKGWRDHCKHVNACFKKKGME